MSAITGRSAGSSPAREQRPNEVRALAALAFEQLQGFPGGARDMHLGIARRAFRGVGPASRPVQRIHDELSGRAYGAIASGAELIARATDAAIVRERIGAGATLSSTPRGSAVIGGSTG